MRQTIIDSDYNFSQAIAGTNAPLHVVDRLSMLDVCYFSFDGLRHQGQIIVDQAFEDDVAEIFALMEELKFPVGKVIPICAYGWRDDDSMKDNNSSGFNFRLIEGTTNLSLHALGRALDINPLQNPIIYPGGIIAPAGAAYDPRQAGTLSAEHPVVEEFLIRGWRWGGNFDHLKDYHHFEKI
ncbi:MAG TPA: M15 family peptidase [Deltaproteobacteria bacterium]|nr:M15 family peptidase [Deltaproteobacteria bacterium]